MNTNTSGAILLLILAMAGLMTGNAPVYLLAAVTAALAFVTDDLTNYFGRHATSGELRLIRILALASWGTTAAAFILLLIN